MGTCHNGKINKASCPLRDRNDQGLLQSAASLLSGNEGVSWWPIQQFSAGGLFAAGNCHDISGFISVKFPEQMNALLELSLGRHER